MVVGHLMPLLCILKVVNYGMQYAWFYQNIDACFDDIIRFCVFGNATD